MDKVRSPLFFAVLFAWLSFSGPGFGASLELDAYLAEVRAHNPVIIAAHHRHLAARDRVKPAGTLDDPFFAAGLDQLPFGGEDMSVARYQINQTLPFPGKLRGRMRVADAFADAGEADAETLTRQTVVTATYLFYKAYYLQESLRNNAGQRAFVRSIAESEESRYKAGESAHHEWLLATAEEGILKTEALRLHSEKAVLEATLNRYRGKPVDTPLGRLIVRRISSWAADGDDLADQPEYKAYRAQLKAAEEQKRLAKLSWVPDFMVQAMAMQSFDTMREPSNWGAMVGLNVPVFGYRKQAKLVAAADHDAQAARAELQDLAGKLETSRKAFRLEAAANRNVLKLYRDAILPQTELAFESARSDYAVKKLPLSSLLQIARVKQTQRLEYLAAQLDVAFAGLKGREWLSESPFPRFAPSVPTLFAPTAMGAPMDQGMAGDGSAAGMGGSGMSGPAAKPQRTGASGDSGMSGGGM